MDTVATGGRRPPAISRRTVLAAAATGAAGMAAARLLALRDAGAVAAIDIKGAAAGAGLDWISPLEKQSARVAQLLRRASLGGSSAELEQALSNGFARTVDRLLDTPPAEPAAFPAGDAATRSAPLRIPQLQLWWLDHMIATPTPCAEAMTLFWHGHFTSDFRKVGPQSPYLYWQNLTWRRFALGDLRTMLYQMTIDPAMLRYLDLSQSTGNNPNENFSRELMELFTMGAGSFTEEDVRASAKALAGWREPLTAAMVKDLEMLALQRGATRRIPIPDEVKTGVFEPRRAYSGTLTFLGKTGRFRTEDVIDRILEQPATATFIARKVARHFVDQNPDDAYVNRLADTFRRSGYRVKDLMRAVFVSPEFSAPANYRALVKSPVEYAVEAARALGNPQLTRVYQQYAPGMGQSLFDPPDVGGWPSNESWVSSSTMLARANFATAVVQQTRSLPSLTEAVARQLDGVLSPQTAELLNTSRDDRFGWGVLLASPEFQLK